MANLYTLYNYTLKSKVKHYMPTIGGPAPAPSLSTLLLLTNSVLGTVEQHLLPQTFSLQITSIENTLTKMDARTMDFGRKIAL